MKYLLGVSAAAIIMSVGFYKSKYLSNCVKTLKAIIHFLSFCRTEIEYFESTASSIVNSYSRINYDYLPFINECSLNLCEYDFPKAWQIAVEQNSSYISVQDKELLYQLGRELGTSDKMSQLRLIDYISHSVEISLGEKAEKEKNEKRLYSVTGVVLGALAFILIV